jgi:hypothetical protein
MHDSVTQISHDDQRRGRSSGSYPSAFRAVYYCLAIPERWRIWR